MTVVEHTHDSGPQNPRPAFAHPRLILYVLLGGAIGTGGREAIALALPAHGGVPWAVLIANLSGALLLGFVLTALAARTPETPARRDLRLFVGTGMMGGFTTYSSLATDTAVLLETDAAVGIAYALASVVAGIAAAAAGIAIARAVFGAPRPGATS